MIRLKISNFIKKYKAKLMDLAQKLTIVAVVVLAATILLFTSSNNGDTTNQTQQDRNEVYKPTDTIILGTNISSEQYETDSNLINKFLDYCNNGQVEEAYSLLSNHCKTEIYPTQEDFSKYYHSYIFEKKRECNLQSWISTTEYTVYKVRYSNDMMATGTYDENDVYEDYLTLNKKGNKEEITIGNLIESNDCNIVSKIDEIEATVVKENIYLNYVEYKIKIKNNTRRTILLDNLKTSDTIKLISYSGSTYKPYINEIFFIDLIIEPNEERTISIKFKKNASTIDRLEKIEMLNIIRDYDAFEENKEEYSDIIKFTIDVGGIIYDR